MEPSVLTWFEESLLLGACVGVVLILVICVRLYSATASKSAASDASYLRDVQMHTQAAKLAGEKQICQQEQPRVASLSKALRNQHHQIASALPHLLQFSLSLSNASSLGDSPICIEVDSEVKSAVGKSTHLGVTSTLPMSDSVTFGSTFVVDPLTGLSPSATPEEVHQDAALVFRVKKLPSRELVAMATVSHDMVFAEVHEQNDGVMHLRLTPQPHSDKSVNVPMLDIHLLSIKNTHASRTRQLEESKSTADDDNAVLEEAWTKLNSYVQLTEPFIVALKTMGDLFHKKVKAHAKVSLDNAKLRHSQKLLEQEQKKNTEKLARQEQMQQVALAEADARHDTTTEHLRTLKQQHSQVLQQKQQVVTEMLTLRKHHQNLAGRMQSLLAYNTELLEKTKHLQRVLKERTQLGVVTMDSLIQRKLNIAVSCRGLELRHSATVQVQVFNHADEIQDTQRTEPLSSNGSPNFSTHFTVSYSTSMVDVYLVFSISDSQYPALNDEVVDANGNMQGFNTALNKEERERKRREAAVSLGMALESGPEAAELGKFRVPLFRLVPSDDDAIVKAQFSLSPAQGSLALEVRKLPPIENPEQKSDGF